MNNILCCRVVVRLVPPLKLRRHADGAGAIFSGGSRSIPEGFLKEEAKEQFISLCKRMAPKEVKYEGRMSIECSWKSLEEQAAPHYK